MMLTRRLAGVDKAVSRLVLGCDNKRTLEDGAALWDAFVAVGGTTFDTAHIYADGDCERALGAWIDDRAIADNVAVIVKGGHTPGCDPENIVAQLHVSLDRLMLPAADIYIMHRDNSDIPVGAFVDVLNDLADAGLIKIFGGSNWTVERFRAANAYAQANGKRGLSILNNNLSLARMERPVWPGCVSSSDDATLGFLTETQTAHFSWSSQARGYFHVGADGSPLPEGTGPEECFDSPENRERRRRAQALADRLGVTAAHVATAYVLCQPFPSFALIGPRTIAELEDNRAALSLSLSEAQRGWLNLTADDLPW